MPRELSVAAVDAVTAEVVSRAIAVALEFDSGVVRLASTTWDIEFDGDTFLGVGQLGGIAAVEEAADLASTELSLTLSSIPPDLIAVTLSETYQNRRGTIYEVPLDPVSLEPIADPIVLFRGRMDVMTVHRGRDAARVEVRLTNRLVDWERPRKVLFSDEEHQRRAPGDLSFRYAAAMAERQVVWPTGDAYKKGVFGQ